MSHLFPVLMIVFLYNPSTINVPFIFAQQINWLCHGDFIQNTQGSVSKIYLFHCYLGHIWSSICQQLPLFYISYIYIYIYIYIYVYIYIYIYIYKIIRLPFETEGQKLNLLGAKIYRLETPRGKVEVHS